jgi:hypothetical protein
MRLAHSGRPQRLARNIDDTESMSTLVAAKPLSIATGDDYLFHRGLNERVLLVCPFSSDQPLAWPGMHKTSTMVRNTRYWTVKENKKMACFHHSFPDIGNIWKPRVWHTVERLAKQIHGDFDAVSPGC